MKPNSHTGATQLRNCAFKILNIIHFCTEVVRLQDCWFMCSSYSSVIEWVVTSAKVKQYEVFSNEGNNVKAKFLLCVDLTQCEALEEPFKMNHFQKSWKALQRWASSICALIALNIRFIISLFSFFQTFS